VGEIDGEVREDLVHLLGRLAPGRPEVHGRRPRPCHRRLQLRRRTHLPHRPAARHPLFSVILRGGWMKRDVVVDLIAVKATGVEEEEDA